MMHLAPLAGIETGALKIYMWRIPRCISHPLRGLKHLCDIIINISFVMHLAPLAGIET